MSDLSECPDRIQYDSLLSLQTIMSSSICPFPVLLQCHCICILYVFTLNPVGSRNTQSQGSWTCVVFKYGGSGGAEEFYRWTGSGS